MLLFVYKLSIQFAQITENTQQLKDEGGSDVTQNYKTTLALTYNTYIIPNS